MGARIGAPRFELADLVRAHRPALSSAHALTRPQRRVLTDIAQCRTAVLGGHLDFCEYCGYEHPSYNSCRNRHCPKCQALAQQLWIEQQRARLVEAPHFHVVFTLPAQLRPLARFAPTTLYTLLFACASATLRAFARRRLGVTLGATLVLHTWTKELRFHPHVHAIVSGGGLRGDGVWVAARKDFLFPVQAMSRVFRGKMRHALRKAQQAHAFDGFDDFCDPQGFDRLLRQLGAVRWYVYAKRSFDRAKYVVDYLGRYTHRVALSNSRIVAVSDTRVVLRTRGKERVAMTPVELLRRFLLHVLPEGFHKIRHYGLYARAKLRERAHRALGSVAPKPLAAPDFQAQLRALTGRDLRCCPRCRQPLVRRTLPTARAPPRPTPI